MNSESRTDRVLIAIAILILLLTSGLYYFDTWMWGQGKARGETIGAITLRRGDVRLKYEDDLKWQKASNGQALAYNDAIYSGAGGQAELSVGQSKMTLTENTLIVLRRESRVSFLNLSYGTLLGKIAKNDKVMVDVGSGPPLLLTSSKSADIVLSRVGRETKLEVRGGEANVVVNGRTTKLGPSKQIVLGSPLENPAKAAVTAASPAPKSRARLKALAPRQDETLIGVAPFMVPFRWGWADGRAVEAKDEFTLEFANDPKFGHVHAHKHVVGRLETTMRARQSLSLYYRVRASNGEVSNTERVNFVAIEPPLIVSPVADAKFDVRRGENALVNAEFRRPKSATVWYQVAADPSFETVAINRNTAETVDVTELPKGEYVFRARTDYGQGRVSAWTEPRRFSVIPRLEPLDRPEQDLLSRVVIPNAEYPAALYRAEPAVVSAYLAERRLLHDYFARVGPFGELKLKLQSEHDEVSLQRDSAWPQAHLKPGLYNYTYQINRSGFLPSPWSNGRSLEIGMAPPRALGEPIVGTPDAHGRRDVQIKFTPLLFARSYDFEVAEDRLFSRPHAATLNESRAKLTLKPGRYFWRTRGRDENGHVISAYSQENAFAVNRPPPPPPPVAPPPKVEPPSAPPLASKTPPRAPAAVESIATKIVEEHRISSARSGWWAWLGSGENYVDYKQSIAGTGTLDSQHTLAGSTYVEAGYLSGSGVGGVFAYKNTPGLFDNANSQRGIVPIVPNSYRWTTASIEALAKRAVNASPLVYGMRAGVQQHQIPFLSLAADASEIQIKNNQMTTASFGVLGEWLGHRWKHYSLLRYQFPLSTKADGASSFSITPKFAFDGSIGTSYNITEQLKLGLFFYGQWHQMNFAFADANVVNAGFQSLFYSSVDLRLGFDF